MSYENVNFSKPNMTVVDGYFYTFDEDWDGLIQKIDDGAISFTYPLHTPISNVVKSLEYDGVNFWTLQICSASGIAIKRWRIEDHITNLKDEFICEGSGHLYDSDAFTVEHYHISLTTTVSGGSDDIQVDNYYDTVISGGLTLTLGPNDSNQYEDVVVDTVSGTNIMLTSDTQHSYDSGDEVNFYTNLWVFNNYDGMNDTGALYKFNAHTGNYITRFGDAEYKNITACTFTRANNIFSSDVDALVYVKSTNLKFVNIDTLANYGVMIMDNIRIDQMTIIPIYDLSISGNTLYRLQDEATYYGSDNTDWSTYNYQVSTIRPFVDSITVTAYPLILPANAKNITEVTAAVFDQYGNGAENKPVFFTDDDGIGYITINPAYTDYFFGTGEAKTAYRAGTAIHTVNIEGTATQND